MSLKFNGTDGITYNDGTQQSTAYTGEGGEGIPEAPVDGKQYGRQDKEWTEVTGGGGTGDGYTKAEIDAQQSAQDVKIDKNIDDIQINADAIAAIPAPIDSYTKAEVDAQQTTQDTAIQANADAIADLPEPVDAYTKAEIDAQQTAQDDVINTKATIGDSYLKAESDATNEAQDVKIKANEDAIDALPTPVDAYTKTETDTKLDLKADKSDTYTKTQTDTLLDNKANVGDSYTKAETYSNVEVDTKLFEKADKAATYTKAEVDDSQALQNTEIVNKADKTEVYTKAEIDTQQSEQDTKIDKNTADIAAIPSPINTYTKSEIDASQAAQDAEIDTKIGDAPANGEQYVRKDGLWSELAAADGGITDAPADGKTYGRRDLKWEEVTSDAYTEAETDALLNDKADKADTYTKAEVDASQGLQDTAIQANTDAIASLPSPVDTYTKTEIDAQQNAQDNAIAVNTTDIEALVDNKADKVDTYTKAEIDVEQDAQDVAIADNATNIATTTADVAQNTTDIAQNTADIATNTGNISSNTTAIGTLSGQVADNSADIAELQDSIFFSSAYAADYPVAPNRDPEVGNMYLQNLASFTYAYAEATQIFASKTDESGNVRQFTAIKAGDSIVLNEVNSPNYGRYELVSVEDVSGSYVVMNVIPKLGEGTVITGVKVAFQAFPKPESGTGDGIPEAPIDGKQYARQDAIWTEVEASGGGGDGYTKAEIDAQQELQDNAIDANTSNISTNTTDIAINISNIAANTTDIATNTAAIAALPSYVDAYSKTETNTLLDAKANTDASYLKAETYSNVETDAKLFTKADKDDTYTKTETDAEIAAAAGGPFKFYGDADVTQAGPNNPVEGQLMFNKVEGYANAYWGIDPNILIPVDSMLIYELMDTGKWGVVKAPSNIPDAPVDGKQYARRDATWSEVVGSAGGDGVWSIDEETGHAYFDGTADVRSLDSYYDITIGPYRLNAAHGMKVGHGSGGFIDSNGNPTPLGSNVAIGYDTLIGGTLESTVNYGTNNTAVGYYAMRANLGGNQNTALGAKALSGNNANKNTAVGSGSMQFNQQGHDNAALGNNALQGNVEGHYNTAMGNAAGLSITGSFNTAIGHRSGISSFATRSGDNCTFIGYNSKGSSDQVSNEITLGDENVDKVRMGNGHVIYDAALGGSDIQEAPVDGKEYVRKDAEWVERSIDGIWDIDEESGNAFYDGIIDVKSVESYNDLIIGPYKTNAARGMSIGHGPSNQVDYLGRPIPISSNIAIGYGTLVGGLNPDVYNTGQYLTAIGYNALAANTQGTRNVAIGYQTLTANTIGSDNTAVGISAASGNWTGKNNVAVGRNALSSNNDGDSNTAIGNYSGQNIKGNFNSALGYQAGNSSLTGDNNTLIGYGAQASSSTVSNEIVLGNADVTVVRMGNGDVIYPADGDGGGGIGGTSIWTESTGIDDEPIATYKGDKIIVGDVDASVVNGIAIGHGRYGTSSCLGIGYETLNSNLGLGNMAIGFQSMKTNTTGTKCVAIGYQTLNANSAGFSNTAIGYQSSYGNWTGDKNTAIGKSSLLSNNTGNNNTAIGENALANSKGSNNTALGTGAGDNITSGTNNTVIGYDAKASSGTATNEVTLGNADVTVVRMGNGTPLTTTTYVQEQLAIKDKLIEKLSARLDALEKRIK